MTREEFLRKKRKDQIVVARLYSKKHDGEWDYPLYSDTHKMHERLDRKYVSVRLKDKMMAAAKASDLPCHLVTMITDDMYLVEFRVKDFSKKLAVLLNEDYVIVPD